MNTATTFEQKIAPFTAKIERQARYIATFSPGYDADDLYQTAISKLYEKSLETPILDQPEAFIISFTGWRMRNLSESARIYNKYMGSEKVVVMDGDEESSFEFIASDESQPEEKFVERERIDEIVSLVKTLPERDQEVVSMIYEGYSQVEIAAELGITKGRVTQIRQKIASQLAASF